MDSDPLSLGSKPLHHVSLEESTDGAQSPVSLLRCSMSAAANLPSCG